MFLIKHKQNLPRLRSAAIAVLLLLASFFLLINKGVHGQAQDIRLVVSGCGAPNAQLEVKEGGTVRSRLQTDVEGCFDIDTQISVSESSPTVEIILQDKNGKTASVWLNLKQKVESEDRTFRVHNLLFPTTLSIIQEPDLLISGYAAPDAKVQLHISILGNPISLNTENDGYWEYKPDTEAGLLDEEYEVKAVVQKDGKESVGFPTVAADLEEERDLLTQVRELTKSLQYPAQVVTYAAPSLSLFSLIYVILDAAGGNLTLLPRIITVLLQALGLVKRKEPWGVVFDAVSNKPIPFAIVRVYDKSKNALINSAVSDLKGRYGFVLSVGEYYLTAEHSDYVFPSELYFPKGKAERLISQGELTFYGGQSIRIEKAEQAVDFSIPLDPRVQISTVQKLWIRTSKMFKGLTIGGLPYPFVILMIVCSIIAVIHAAILLNIVLCLLSLALFTFKIAKSIARPRTWGVVYSSKDGKPVSVASTKLYEDPSRKVIDTQITDHRGRFRFFVPKGKYFFLAAAPGYKFPSKIAKEMYELAFYESLIKVNAEETGINVDVPVDPVSGGSPFSG